MAYRATLLAVLAAVASLAAADSGGDGTFSKVLLSNAVQTHNARCLDGSAPGYFIRRGAPGSRQWVVHAEGGGWCWTADQCLARSTSSLGTSTVWGNTTNCYGVCDGILSANATLNPDFYTWNAVFIGYCDGGSFSGQAAEPLMYQGKPLYFRGRSILTSVIEDILSSQGMAQATDVIFTGGSAGGLTTYLQADYVASMLPAGVKYRAMGDAGFFLDHTTETGEQSIRPLFQNMFSMMNSSYGVNDACMQANTQEPWKCVFAQYTAPYLRTPFFILEGAYDSWQLHNILQLSCGEMGRDMKSFCNASELAIFQAYGATMRTTVNSVLANQTSSGAFVSACIVHCQSIYNEGEDRWAAWNISGLAPRDVFANWYFDRAGSGREVQACDYPCNPSCPVFT